jgi:regulator of sigma E protease
VPLGQAFSASWRYISLTAATIAQLLQPAHAGEVIENSTSVVGISVMASEAAQEGASSLLFLAAAISLSLGFMNLLPIPPLDGGKLVLEIIAVIIRRPVPIKVQTVISYVGMALFLLLFFVLLRQDIVRFILGG